MEQLEYRDNIQYAVSNEYSIDEQITELNALCKEGLADYELYQRIRSYIYRQIKIKELAVTSILNDIRQIRCRSQKAANVLQFFIIHNDYSYSQIAEQFGCSKQYIYQTLQRYATQLQWLQNLMKIKGYEDSKNENNRAIRFNSKPKKKKYIQMDMFNVDDGADNDGSDGV